MSDTPSSLPMRALLDEAMSLSSWLASTDNDSALLAEDYRISHHGRLVSLTQALVSAVYDLDERLARLEAALNRR